MSIFSDILNEPTGEQCSDNALIKDTDSEIAYACWYPQMGGYAGRAIAIFLKDQADTFGMGGCIDVLIWHDGEFPFGSPKLPVLLHHCVADQFVEFGSWMKSINKSQEHLDHQEEIWKIEYDNDTGTRNESYAEWWTVTDGNKEFKTSYKEEAEWLQKILNSYKEE